MLSAFSDAHFLASVLCFDVVFDHLFLGAAVLQNEDRPENTPEPTHQPEGSAELQHSNDGLCFGARLSPERAQESSHSGEENVKESKQDVPRASDFRNIDDQFPQLSVHFGKVCQSGSDVPGDSNLTEHFGSLQVPKCFDLVSAGLTSSGVSFLAFRSGATLIVKIIIN